MPDIITVVFTPPDKGAGKAAFEAACMDMGDKLNPMCTQINAAVAAINADAVAAGTAKADAQTAQSEAEAARDAAIAAALAAAPFFQSGVAYVAGDMVINDNTGARLFLCIAGYTSGATLPSDDTSHWREVFVSQDALAAVDAKAISALSEADARLDVPIIPKASAYTLELSDRGKCISTTAGVTIPANAAVAFPVGAVVLVRNTSGATISISITSDTLRLSGTTKTGARTLGPYGTATLHKDAATVWYASGAGLA